MMQTTLCYLESNDRYLMLHRIKKKQDVNAGKWIGIGGKFERGEAPEDCMIREAYEETGLLLQSLTFRGILTFIYADKEPEYIFTYTSDSFIPAYAAGSTIAGESSATAGSVAAGGSERTTGSTSESGSTSKTESSLSDVARGDKERNFIDDAAMEMLMETMPEARLARDIMAAAGVESKSDIEIPMTEGVLRWVPKKDVMSLNLWEGDRFMLEYLLKDRQRPFSLKLMYDAQDNLIEAYELSEGVRKLK